MCKILSKLLVCLLLACLIWGGTVIADIVNLPESAGEYRIELNLDAQQIQEVKEKAGVYAEKAKDLLVETLTVVDKVIDRALVALKSDKPLENIFVSD